MKRDDLSRYQEMRDFDVTREPSGKVAKAPTSKNGKRTKKHAEEKELSFVVQRHAASRLHYDFRLELDGVLKSWAVPKGPSLFAGEKRLAVQVEDHPLAYGGFEGSIPHGEYGGGHVLVWDEGTWTPEGDPHEGLKAGKLKFTLHGDRLHGGYTLVQMKGARVKGAKQKQWLLLKERDAAARKTGKDVTETEPMPALETFQPQLATLSTELPKGEPWLFEPKLDGYRAIASLEEGESKLFSRSGKDWTEKFAVIRDAIQKLKVTSIVLDGEVCALDDHGVPNFQALQNALSSPALRRNLVYFVFDVLFVDGYDVRDRPLAVRKALLESILHGQKEPLSYVRHVEASEGKKLFELACENDMEGVIAKRSDRTYVGERSRDWLKVKCTKRQEMVIVGYTAPQNSRAGFGALLLGVNEKGRLRYAGKVGTGFSDTTLREIGKKLDALVVRAPPVEDAPRMRGATWVKPQLVAEVSFSEWTEGGALRHPSFLGLREDKKPGEVKRERAVAAPKTHATKAKLTTRKPASDDAEDTVLGVRISHPERIVDHPSHVSKLELARYHEAVHAFSLPYMIKRPISLLRCPDGDKGESFFQKARTPGMPKTVHTKTVHGHNVIWIEDAEGLISLVQFGSVELHGWGSSFPEVGNPNWIVMDLDPDEGLPFPRVVDGALAMRDMLASIGLKSFVKTTGGKGLHVCAPLKPLYSWDQIKPLTQAIAEKMSHESPALYTANMAKKARGGKIFIDYLRNGDGSTAILPYSPRARPNFPVAMPIAWRDVEHVDPMEFTVKTAPAILAKRKRDPWVEFLSLEQELEVPTE